MESKSEAVQWWRALDRHSQWLAIERWRESGEPGADMLAALIQSSPEHIARIWAAEKAREMGKASQNREEKSGV